MVDVPATDSFFAAPFAVDGELMGVAEWHVSDLSPRWLRFCEDLLSQREAFKTPLPGPLAHLELRFTSAQGAALATFLASGQLVVSAAYLRGDNPDAEQELLSMFVESLRRSAFVQCSQAGQEPFGAVFGLNQRPLHVVVAWANPRVADNDEELVRELGNHLAAAFLCASPCRTKRCT